MNNEPPEKNANQRYIGLSLVVSGLSSLFGASVLIAGRGGGMEALSMLVPLIIFAGGGLVVAMALALMALARGEQRILGIVAIRIPPVAGILAQALWR